MGPIKRVAALLAIYLAAIGGVTATPITYYITGSGGGFLGSTLFGMTSPADFVIVAHGDTDNITECTIAGSPIPHCLENPNSDAEIKIDGLGIYQILWPTDIFANTGEVGMSVTGAHGPFDVLGAAIFANWHMDISVAGFTTVVLNDAWFEAGPVPTSGGPLVFQPGSSDGYFIAKVGVPEPSAISVFGAGLFAAAGFACRRKMRRERAKPTVSDPGGLF